MIKGQDLVESKQYNDSLKWVFGSKKNHFPIIQAYSLVAIQETLVRILAVLEDKQYKTKQVERRSRETPDATTARVDAEYVLHKRLQDEKVEEVEEKVPQEDVIEEVPQEEVIEEIPMVDENTDTEKTEKPKLKKRVKI